MQITVDQLRGDLPDKTMKNMGEGGFCFTALKMTRAVSWTWQACLPMLISMSA